MTTNIKSLILLLLSSILLSFSQNNKSQRTIDKTPSIVNIYNFIRKTSDPNNKFSYCDFETIVNQIEVNKRHGFVGTYALKYDALMDERYQKLLKEKTDEHDEIGVWWEITQELAEKSGVVWKGNTPNSRHVDSGYCLAYEVEDRLKMIDVYMADFKEIFGYYPKSIGSWVIDIQTFKYSHEKYGLTVGAICRDQIGLDGFTLIGGYFDQAYYPSIYNEYTPAQTIENQLNMPIFRLLGSDPIYSYENGIRKGISGVYTMEPSWERGRNQKFIDWYFDCKNSKNNLGFSYTQIGQENTFLWPNIEEGYEKQLSTLFELATQGEIRVETLKESGDWFSKKYKRTPVSSIKASSDWTGRGLKTIWYNSRFYRTSLLKDGQQIYIRDLFLFNENYPSRYLSNVLKERHSIFDALPIIDPHRYKAKEKRTALYFVQILSDNIKQLKSNKLDVKAVDQHTLNTKWEVNDTATMNFIMKEGSIECFLSNKVEHLKWALQLTKCPTFNVVNKKELALSHNNFDYTLKLTRGSFSMQSDSSILILPEDNNVKVQLHNDHVKVNNDYFTEDYLKESEDFDKIKIFKPIYGENIRLDKPVLSITSEYKTCGKESFLTMKASDPNITIRYTINGNDPNEYSKIYSKPLSINKTSIVKARSFKDGTLPSRIAKSKHYRSKQAKYITTRTNPTKNKAYNNNDVNDLIDKKKGGIGYADGNWLGYLDDIDVTVDLGEQKCISKINLSFLQSARVWIFFPDYVSFFVSKDNKEFKQVGMVKNNDDQNLLGIKDFEVNFKGGNYRYVKVFAKWQGSCPSWSPCYNLGDCYMFVDEICIE